VFPFFLFAVGNALAFVMPRLESGGDLPFLGKVLKRSISIFAIGLFLNWFPFVRWSDGHLVFKYWVNPQNPESGIRILGVLQRIALCYCFASLIIYYLKIRGAFVLSAIILLGYWVLCLLFGSGPDPYSMQGYFGLVVDKNVLGVAHMYKGEGVPFDPEGLASTLPAIVQVIFGYFAGNYILQKGKNHEMLANLFVAGCVLVFMGFCWDMVFPINKKIWSSSFVVYTSGIAMLILSVLIQVIEFRDWKGKWSRFFDVFGKNPLFIFVLSDLIPRLLGLIRWSDGIDAKGGITYTTPLEWFYEQVCKPVSENLKNGSLLYAIITVCFFWLIAFLLDKKRVYIRV
jgi:predicted acyltransferase